MKKSEFAKNLSSNSKTETSRRKNYHVSIFKFWKPLWIVERQEEFVILSDNQSKKLWKWIGKNG
jgi:hypothetical protein